MKYRIIDLFSGAGGMTLGFVDGRFEGGFDCILAVDNDRAAIATHEKFFGGESVPGNIEDWLKKTKKIPQADIVIGGPPCQGFSLLNKNREGDERRALWEPYMDIVKASGAKVFVMENVKELLKSTEFDDIRARAEKLGFKIVADVLNAADYGAPQTRRRAVIVGWNEKAGVTPPEFPPRKTHSAPTVKDDLPNWVTVKEAIGDLPSPVGTEIRDSEAPLNLHFGRNPTKMSLARYKVVPPGGNRFDLQKNAPELTPPCWLRKPSGGTDLFGRLWWDRPSVTIRTEFFKPEKGRYLHPVKHRPITHREAARLMGFPDDFPFTGSKTEIAKQIGNAVPPPLAKAIAKMVKDMLKTKKTAKAA
ncbi:DNA cytosine methyltransferase [Collimonas sp. PA-H2]|uniref:DNA cytosine methyltransferase n=1 Tax=Collimonas sp. PA-H2 TaxID=1881062 RepID=UPI000BF5211B|nr:DNA cytosine methyltransferase [Collimonas sp. PA-H2]